jgi:hypothetical protein
MTQHQAVDETTAIPLPPTSPGVGQIYGKMVAIMRALDAIGKTKQCTAPGANFAFRGIDQVYNALHPLMCEHGVFMLPERISKERSERLSSNNKPMAFTTLHMRYWFVAEDGSRVFCEVEGEGMDNSDKSSNKAMSVAHKYAILQTFCIPTEDAVDPDAEKPELGGTPQNPNAITAAQRDELNKWIADSGATVDDFCKHWKIEAVPDLAPKDFPVALNMLKTRKQKMAAKAATKGK